MRLTSSVGLSKWHHLNRRRAHWTGLDAKATAKASIKVDFRATASQGQGVRIGGAKPCAGATLGPAKGQTGRFVDDHDAQGPGAFGHCKRTLGAGGGAGKPLAHMTGPRLGHHHRCARAGLDPFGEHVDRVFGAGFHTVTAAGAAGEKKRLADRTGGPTTRR